jgi:GTP-binding protein HflX
LLFFERPESGERTVLVHLDLPDESCREDPLEFEMLALSAGADPVSLVTGTRQSPHPKFFVGLGKLEEIRDVVRHEEAELVIFNHQLSPSQERNIEKELKCRVLDRTGLILDIFAQRARTHEGKLQVELAQLQHLSTRLVRGWTHLERQKGGIGLRGPGETQLESDRRMLRARISAITARLDKVRKTRDQSRRARKRNEVPTVSLVGYTNAGKSTLFNALTVADVYAADQLFATLDPTLRRLRLADVGDIVLADTVGFIRHLPHKLVEAFRATLEEAQQSDLLLHVVDACAAEREENIHQVQQVLKEIKAHEIPCIEVYNKIDLMGDAQPRIERDEITGLPCRVWVSARNQQGLDLVKQAVDEWLAGDVIETTYVLPPQLSKLRSRLYAAHTVMKEDISSEGWSVLQIRGLKKDVDRILKQEGVEPDSIIPNHPAALDDKSQQAGYKTPH